MLISQAPSKRQTWLELKQCLRSQIENKRLQVIKEREKNRKVENEEIEEEESKQINEEQEEEIDQGNSNQDVDEEEDDAENEEEDIEIDEEEEDNENEDVVNEFIDVEAKDDDDYEEDDDYKENYDDGSDKEENDEKQEIDDEKVEENNNDNHDDDINLSFTQAYEEKRRSSINVPSCEEENQNESVAKDNDLDESFVSFNSMNESFQRVYATQNLGFSPYAKIQTQSQIQTKSSHTTSPFKLDGTQLNFDSQELLGLCSGVFTSPLKTKEDDDDDDDVFKKPLKKGTKIVLDSESEDEEDDKKNKQTDDDYDYDNFSLTDGYTQKKDENYSEINSDEEIGDEEDDESNGIDDEVNVKDFFENEAELSGEEGSSDEEENEDDDNLAEPEEVEDLPSEDELREQIGRVQHKQLLDQDKREILLMREMMFEDGDMHDDGKARERKFRWKDSDNSDWKNVYLDYDTDSGTEDEEEIKRPTLKLDNDDNSNTATTETETRKVETNVKMVESASTLATKRSMTFGGGKINNITSFILRDERLKNVLSTKRPSPLKMKKQHKKQKKSEPQVSVFDFFNQKNN